MKNDLSKMMNSSMGQYLGFQRLRKPQIVAVCAENRVKTQVRIVEVDMCPSLKTANEIRLLLST